QGLAQVDGELRRLREGGSAARAPRAARKGRPTLRSRTLRFVPHPSQGATLAEAAREDQGSLSLDEAKETIPAKGRERGFVTSEDLLESVPVEDFTPEQVEDFLTQIEEHLRGEGIDIIDRKSV